MNSPFVTILSPCYNVEKFLPQCIESIINQTYHNLQIVMIDDGSTDNTWQILEEYAKKDSRIEIYHQENHGVAYTRNKLLDKIKGQYFLFVDSDDWMETIMVEFLLNKAFENKVDIAICGNVINNDSISNISTEKIFSKNEVIKKFLYHIEVRGSLWNKLVKTSLLHNERFRCGISYGEDALFCWHIFQNATKFLISDRRLYHYRMVKTSLCHSSFSQKKLSGHYVWAQICKETESWYPEYLHIAKARHCIEDTLLLRDAAHSGHSDKNDVALLQASVRQNLRILNKVKITSVYMKLYAFLASRSYWLASKF